MSEEIGGSISAEDVKRIRAALSASQREMAKALGVSPGYVALLESGSRSASKDVTRRLRRLEAEALVGTIGGTPPIGVLTADPDERDFPSTGSSFTILVGAVTAAQRSYAANWIQDLADATHSRTLWIDLLTTPTLEALHESLLSATPSPYGKVSEMLSDFAASSAEETVTLLERGHTPDLILAFSNWQPRGGEVDQFVGELGLLANKLRVVAISAITAPAIPGVNIVPVPTKPEPAAPASGTQTVRELGRDLRPDSDVAALLQANLDDLRADPQRWITRLTLLAERGGDHDISQARAELRLLLDLVRGEGIRWRLMTLGADVALRANDYPEAEAYVAQLETLVQEGAGAYDATPARVLRARALWEQGNFEPALTALNDVRPLRAEDACRVANWRARCHASLGDVAAALRSADAGRATADQHDLLGGLAYSLVLCGQYELYRGNFVRARRHLDRALHLSNQTRELRARPQILMTLADADVMEGPLDAARDRLGHAMRALSSRPRRLWDSAYYNLAQARITRRSLNLDAICSMAQVLQAEAAVVSTRAPQHPVVPALYAEAASSWMAANYAHQAGLVIAKTDWSAAEWVTLLQRDAVLIAVSVDDPVEYLSQARELLERAQAGGAAYLAVEYGFELAVRASTRWQAVAAPLARWTLHSAEARGWKRISEAVAGIASVVVPDEARGDLVHRSGGDRTLFAPPRGQVRARGDRLPPLPDPFDVEGGE